MKNIINLENYNVMIDLDCVTAVQFKENKMLKMPKEMRKPGEILEHHIEITMKDNQNISIACGNRLKLLDTYKSILECLQPDIVKNIK